MLNAVNAPASGTMLKEYSTLVNIVYYKPFPNMPGLRLPCKGEANLTVDGTYVISLMRMTLGHRFQIPFQQVKHQPEISSPSPACCNITVVNKSVDFYLTMRLPKY